MDGIDQRCLVATPIPVNAKRDGGAGSKYDIDQGFGLDIDIKIIASTGGDCFVYYANDLAHGRRHPVA